MSQHRQFQMEGAGSNPTSYTDTTLTKLFVGGLAWETQRETMRRYFEQFGEIVEAVVITDKNTGRSKGYGFVTFTDPEAARRACQNPSPVIDGRRANCNLACLGAQNTRPPFPRHGPGRPRPGPGPGLVSHPPNSTLLPQSSGHFQFPYSGYGFAGYSQEGLYPLNYYNVYGGQQFSPYFNPSGSHGMFQNVYPYYGQYPQSSQAHGFGVQYPSPMVQYPYLPQQFTSPPPPILSLPTSFALAPATSAGTTSAAATASSPVPATTATTITADTTTTVTTTESTATASGQNKSS